MSNLKTIAHLALTVLGYATHDGDCGDHIGEPCDCGYSEAAQGLREAIEQAETIAALSPTPSKEPQGEAA